MTSCKRVFGIPFNKSILGWITYDFANSAFVTVIVTVVYSVYFKKQVVGSEELGTALWGRAVSLSMLMVALIAPFLGAIADHSSFKKRFMLIFCYLSVAFTGALYFVRAGHIAAGMFFFIVANFGFNASNVFYNAFLPELCTRQDMGKVSGLGWGFGYVGGLLALLLSLPLVSLNVRLVFPMIALFYGLFAIVTFTLLKEKKAAASAPSSYIKIAVGRIASTFRNIRKFRDLVRYLIAYLIYNDAIVVVISFAAIYGSTRFNMNAQQLIIYFIIAQVTSILGSVVFGYLIDILKARLTITITLFLWTLVVLWAYFCRSAGEYYLVGILAGIAIGSSQSSSRTMLALLTPREKMAEFFGFYSLTGRLASIMGPLVYGEIARVTGDQRKAILAVLVFFVVGGIILQFVNENRGAELAEEWKEEA